MMATIVPSAIQGRAASDCIEGLWASAAKNVYGADDSGQTVPSPDRTRWVIGKKSSVMIGDSGGEYELPGLPLLTKSLIEVLWSPNSRYVAFTQSDGGAVGTWQVHVYRVGRDGKPSLATVDREAQKLADAVPVCYTREASNLAVAGWREDSSEIFLVGTVPPHSSCKNMAKVTGYQVAVRTGKVLQVLGEKAVLNRWKGTLGCNLREH
jgi:hypothetical protein